MQACITCRKKLHASFRWVWSGSEFELVATIASNKNGWRSNKNLETLIKAISPQSPSTLLGNDFNRNEIYPTLKDGEKNMLTN